MGLALALSIALMVFALFRSGKDPAAPGVTKSAAAQTVNVKRLPDGDRRSGQAEKASRFKKTAGAKKDAGKNAGEKPASVPSLLQGKKESPAEAAAAEKLVEEWEALIDSIAEQTAHPTQEQAEQIKEALHKMGSGDQLDGIQSALNLLPDEQFAVLYPILFDKTENPEILDAIFSDALNRDEEIKVPIMKELYKDKTHPMFVESARILDATGELDEMTDEDDAEEE